VTTIQTLYERTMAEIDKVIKGKAEAKSVLFASFLAGGNVLVEGAPGLAKTLMARSLARTLGLGFSRIQFTPDLMPSDILGTNVYNQKKGEFEFKHGPLFSNFILADEINRAPAKTQAALLEAMEERQVTIDNSTYRLPDVFMVFATQNPIEYEGTYALPEAQTDRFMVRLVMDYPTVDEEHEVLMLALNPQRDLTELIIPVSDAPSQLGAAWRELQAIVIDEKIVTYVRNLVRMTREMPDIALGNSPRSGQMLLRLARAYAPITGSDYVTPDHIRELVPVVLPHRWILKPETLINKTPVDHLLRDLFSRVQVPT
jgi:MoxR-like ATPase